MNKLTAPTLLKTVSETSRGRIKLGPKTKAKFFSFILFKSLRSLTCKKTKVKLSPEFIEKKKKSHHFEEKLQQIEKDEDFFFQTVYIIHWTEKG